jgi:hypothetical protein
MILWELRAMPWAIHRERLQRLVPQPIAPGLARAEAIPCLSACMRRCAALRRAAPGATSAVSERLSRAPAGARRVGGLSAI